MTHSDGSKGGVGGHFCRAVPLKAPPASLFFSRGAAGQGHCKK